MDISEQPRTQARNDHPMIIHLETWPPGWKPHNSIYADILSMYGDIRKLWPQFSYSYISVSSWYTSLVWAKTMTPKLGTVYDFFMMFEYERKFLPSYVGVKNEKSVWRKRIRVTQYNICTGMYWVYPGIYLVFAKAGTPTVLSCRQFIFNCL